MRRCDDVMRYMLPRRRRRASEAPALHAAAALSGLASSMETETRRTSMATRNASAQWNGTLQEGNGTMALGSGAFEGPYTYKSRFEDGPGTNPEELLGAAHAGCFSMALGLALTEAGTPAETINTQARVHLRQQEGLPTITQIDLITRGRVPGIDDAAFKEVAEQAKTGCVVSRALAGVGEVTVDAALES
jgi:lipoyl-dependent peroxiredoxin